MRSLPINLDFVLCIDVSENMKNHISSVKESIGRLYSDICESMEKRGKEIHQCRMRILTFHSSAELCRDFVSATDFFSLPEEREIFSKYVQDIEVNQNSNVLQNGLECLADAIRSRWNNDLHRKRQIIIVWSNAGTCDFNDCNRMQWRDAGAPDDFDELTALWVQHLNWRFNKLLVLYAPDAPDWNRLFDEWDSVVHFTSAAGQGLGKTAYQEILDFALHSDLVLEVEQDHADR